LIDIFEKFRIAHTSNKRKLTMKKAFLALTLITFLAACGGSDSNSGNTESTSTQNTSASPSTTQDTATTENPSNNASTSNGSQLIASSDCLSCHKEKEKLVGPAYSDVAKKYENTQANVTMLAEKVIKGGAGNWGDIPMTPHPSISQGDAEEMVKYILTLK